MGWAGAVGGAQQARWRLGDRASPLFLEEPSLAVGVHWPGPQGAPTTAIPNAVQRSLGALSTGTAVPGDEASFYPLLASLKADLQWPRSAYGRMSTRGARHMYLLSTGPGVAHTNSWGNQVPYQGPLGATQGGSDGQNRETGHNVLGRVFIDEGTALSEDPQRPAGQQAHRARRSACSRSVSVCKARGGMRTGRCASAPPTSS